MHNYPWLETMLTLEVPGVTFRNMGWSGDTVFGDARAVFGSRTDGYQRLMRDLEYAAPNFAILSTVKTKHTEDRPKGKSFSKVTINSSRI